MGARIALEAASWARQLIRGLVLVDGSNAPRAPHEARSELESSISSHGFDATMDDLVESFLIGALPADLQDVMRLRARHLPEQTVLDYAEVMARWDSERFETCVDEINVPIEVLQSTSLVDESWVRSFIDEQPHSRWTDRWDQHPTTRVERRSKTGHYIMIEAPRTVAEAIDRFQSTSNHSSADRASGGDRTHP